MRYKKIMILTIILIFLLAVSAVSAAENATDDIISTDVNEDVVCVEETTDEIVSVENNNPVAESVDEESIVSSANVDGTFTDLANDIANSTGELNLTRNYVYSGSEYKYKNGIIINKNITINGNGFTINGNNTARIFDVNSSNVIFKDIIFVNGNSDSSGGAMSGGSALNCSFINNTARGYGGAIYGGSANKCTFINNSAINGDGGAMRTGSANECTFINNSAINGGAVSGIFAEDSIFINNSAGPYGDAGAMYGGSANNCTFINNSANNYGGAIREGDAINCTFINNYGKNFGGAISGFVFPVSAINCIFINNYMGKYGFGGAIYMCNAENCSFINNSAHDGGAIGRGSANNCIFINNSAENRGAIYGGSANNCTFINNSWGAMYDGSANNCTFINNSARVDGGAINNGNAINCTFVNNSACNGGAINNGSANNCNFINNYARTGDGGAMYGGSAKNCTFVNNSACNGGALYGGSANNCTFINNSARVGDGGALYGGSAKNCTFVNNSALSANGGAINNGNAINCTFVNNSACNGGALYGGSANNCTFINNTAIYGDGGAIEEICISVSILNCIFVNNSANNYGGAIYQNIPKWRMGIDDLIIKNCNFISNYAINGDGGAINYNSTKIKNIIIRKCSFISNSAINGDGGAIIDVTMGFSKLDTILDCTFVNNSARGDGGAIKNISASACSFINNSAETGGAMCGGSAISCTFVNNSARVDGGAINRGNAGTCSFVNNSARYGGAIKDSSAYSHSTFVNNSAENGGAMYGGSAFLVCTFINNSAHEGGAIYCGSANNCILINNSASYGGAMSNCSAYNCNFSGNVASECGGAMYYGYADGCIFNNYSIYDDVYPIEVVLFNPQYNITLNDIYYLENLTFIIRSNIECFVEVTIWEKDYWNSGYNSWNYIYTTNATINCNGSFNIENLPVGTYYAKYTLRSINNRYNVYCEEDKYFDVYKKETYVDLSVNDIVYGESAIVNVTTSDDGEIVLTIGDSVIKRKVFANCINQFDLGILAADTYEIIAKFDAGYNFINSTNIIPLKVYPKQSNLDLTVKDYIYGSSVIVNVSASENGKVSLKLNNLIKNIDVIANKSASIDFGILNSGFYDVVANFTAGNNYKESYNISSLIVSPAQSKIIEIQAQDNTYGENTIIKVKTNVDGNLIVSVGDNTKNINIISNQLTSIDFGVLDVDKYDVRLSLNAGKNYVSAKNTTSVKINPKSTIVTLNVKEYDFNEHVVVNVTTSETGAVTIKLNNIIKNINVIANIAISVDFGVLNSGSYDVIANFTAGNNYVTSSNSASITVKNIVPTTITASAVTTVYNGGKYLVATLKDNDGKAISGVKLTVKLSNGITSTPTTNANGQVKVSTNGLAPNTYTATITFDGNNNYAKSSTTANVVVKKATPVITAAQKNFEPSVKTKKYSITLKNKQNKALKNTKVSIKVNGKTYSATTNNNGVATFKLTKLTKKGTYKAVITYAGNKNYNKATKSVTITVKPTPKITAKKATFKKSVKTKKYTVTLKVNSKVMKKTKVSIKVNKVTYKATTNNKGQATFKITKLTKKGTYKAAVTYAGNKNYNKATKNVNIIVK